MKIDFPQGPNGLYILSRNDIEEIAESILLEYYPQNIDTPQPLNTQELLTDCFGLSLKHKYIGSFDSGILGLIVMNDEAEIPSYDEMFHPTILNETFGTVLISKILDGENHIARRRYTEAHEGSHFVLHSDYFKNDSGAFTRRGSTLQNYIACRKVEVYNGPLKSNMDWIEWQADTLAAALLMPVYAFADYTRKVMREHFLRGDCMIKGENGIQMFNTISKVAETFKVSYQAARIRMIHLGLIKDIDIFP